MKKVFMVCSAVALISGCQSSQQAGKPDNSHCNHSSCSAETIASDRSANSQAPVNNSGWQIPVQYYTSLNSNKQLADYAAQMSMQLIETMHNFPAGSKVAVASFVDLGSELEQTNIVGNQLAESFIHQFQQFGVAVVDFKTTNAIRVTSRGDFVFSRNNTLLDNHQDIDYVLSGTMLHTPKGIMVNARVINFKTKVVAASAQQMIPHFVISSLYPAITR